MRGVLDNERLGRGCGGGETAEREDDGGRGDGCPARKLSRACGAVSDSNIRVCVRQLCVSLN